MTEKNKDTISPEDKKTLAENGRTHSERTIQRLEEEHEYASVIIKRNDAAFKHADDVLQSAIEGGHEQVNRPVLSLFLSAISAGLILGFSAMAVSFAVSILAPDTTEGIKRLVMAVFYPLGFIVCIMSRTELFTEHTALAVYPYLEKLCSLTKLLQLWMTVLAGNLVGTTLSAVLLNLAEPVINAEMGYIYVAEHLVNFTGFQIFISAMLAGWLMALGSWLILSMSTSSSQILGIYIVTFLIGIGGLHHSIAGSAELFTVLIMSNAITSMDVMHTLFFAIIGNLVGGSFFVAILNYAHIRKTQSITLD